MKLNILFVCVENSFRSQIAEGISKKYFSDKINPYSAGSKPIGEIHKNAKIILQEIGINPDTQYSKGFSDIPNIEFDYVITMGCNDVCPFHPSKKHIDWNLPDIKNESIDKIRNLAEKIKNLIYNLLLNDN